MSRKRKYSLKARDKIVTKMGKDGLVELNSTTGDNKRISAREAEFDLRGEDETDKQLGELSVNKKKSNVSNSLNAKRSSQVGTNKTKKNYKRKINRTRQKREFTRKINNHANDLNPKNTSPHSSKSVYQQPQQRLGNSKYAESISEIPSHSISIESNTSDIKPKPSSKIIKNPQHAKQLSEKRITNIHDVKFLQKTDEAITKSKLSFTEDEILDEKFTDSIYVEDVKNGKETEKNVSNKSDGKDETRPPPKSKHAHSQQTSSKQKSKQSDTKSPSSQIDEIKQNPKISKLEYKVKKTTKKLKDAKNKLPTKRKLRVHQTFDESQSKSKIKLSFAPEVKTQKEHLKGPILTRPVKLGVNAAIGGAHRKIFQVEDENVGTKAAHRTELTAESLVRTGLRHRKTAPYQKVAKLERKLTKRSATLEYQRAIERNPKLKSNPVSRMWQKRKIKKRYAKAARETKKTAEKAKKAASLTGKASKFVMNLIKKNPKILVIGLALFLFINIITSLVGFLAGLGSAGAGAIIASSYLSEEQEIEAVSLAYSEWEMDLLMEVLNAEQTYQGYDEYRFNTGDISHNPFELVAFLTATKYEFKYADIETELRALFDEQYKLIFIPSVETRYLEQDEDYEAEPIPYEWHVMTVTLTTRNFTDIVYSRMTAEQRQHYSLLMESRGQRQVVGNPFDFTWFPFITSDYGYRIHPISGNRDLHRGVDIGVPLGTDILAGFDGTIAFAGNNGGYGNTVTIRGNDGLEAKYAHMNSIDVSTGQIVKLGDIIGTVGNTGNSTGPHLHFEVLRNGQYLNPILFVDIGDFDFSNPSNPSFFPPNGTPRPPMSDDTWNAMIAEAEKHLGKPYVFGANGPNAYDCSSYVSMVLRVCGIKDVGRQTAQGLFNLSSPVSGDPHPGDLVFFHSTYSTNNLVTHVGIFAGFDVDGRPVMIHAGSPIQYAYIDTPYWQSHFLAYGRLS